MKYVHVFRKGWQRQSKAKKATYKTILGVVCIVVGISLAWSFLDRQTERQPPVGAQLSPSLGSQPKAPYLEIPSIDVTAHIQEVGLDEKGDMGVPDNAIDVGWYKYGPRPGITGSSVLAGHVDTDEGRTAGVFWDLHKLDIGERVYVTDEDGQRLAFAVTKKASYTPEDAPLRDIFGNTDKTRLNLITCEGKWDPATRTYSHRLVVFTELVE